MNKQLFLIMAVIIGLSAAVSTPVTAETNRGVSDSQMQEKQRKLEELRIQKEQKLKEMEEKKLEQQEKLEQLRLQKEERLRELEAKKAEQQKTIQERLIEMKDKVLQKKTETQEKIEERKDAAQEKREQGYENIANRVEARFKQHEERLNGWIVRAEKHIVDLKAKGKDTAAATKALETAKTSLASASAQGKTAVAQLRAIAPADWQTQKPAVKAAKEAVVAAQKAYAGF